MQHDHTYYRVNHPCSFDQVSEFVENNQLSYSALNDYDKRRLANKLLTDDQDQSDITTADFIEALAMFALDPTAAQSRTLHEQLIKAMEERYSAVISDMFIAAHEKLRNDLRARCEIRAYKDKRDFHQLSFAGAR